MENFLFDNWSTLVRTGTVGVAAYVILIVFLRISGNRILAKMNAFDLVVTISLGSTLSAILLNKDVALLQGALALGLLIGLQYLITWSSLRIGYIRRVVTGEPALLLFRGQYLPESLNRERVTKEDIRSAIRAAGLPALEDTEAVVLETDGTFSVVPKGDLPATILEGVKGAPREGASAHDEHR